GYPQPISFGLGLVIGMIALLLVQPNVRIRPTRLPDQIIGVVIYLLVLFRDIVLSTLDVARRVLSPDMGLKPAIIAISTQDDADDAVVAAMTAHGITITPGELVVDFDGQDLMYVHVLNIDDALPYLDEAQTVRLKRIKRMVGRDD
ncbi:MAG: Na+/H+ antiporter subunit E, partial [Anaerolineae bacterium]